jgi:tetratricopeptide (TPR) repeat protein
MGQLREAEEAYRTLIASYEPHDPPSNSSEDVEYLGRSLSNLSRLLLDSDRFEDAEPECRKALAFWQAHDNREELAQSHLRLATILWRLGRQDKAAAEFNEVLRFRREDMRLNPKDWDAPVALARALATFPDPSLRDPGEAVRLAERAVDLYLKSNHDLAEALKNAGRLDEVLEWSPTGDSWTVLGMARYRAGEWQAAATALETAARFRRGRDSSTYFFLAMSHWRLGQMDKAQEWYDKAVEWMDRNKPHDEELKRFRAEAAALLGVPGEAGAKTPKPPE